MTGTDQHLESLKDIKSMMEKSSKFVSLSGLSGISAGICAIVGASAAYLKISSFYTSWNSRVTIYSSLDDTWQSRGQIPLNVSNDLAFDLVLIALITLTAALISSTAFTANRARKNNHNMWDNTSKRLLTSVSLPLVTGGIFCLILLRHNLFGLLAPTTLVFFGLALINGSKFTLPEIRYVGLLNIVLGLLNGVFIGYGLLFWTLGFGVVNIVYGIYMYNKYERS